MINLSIYYQHLLIGHIRLYQIKTASDLGSLPDSNCTLSRTWQAWTYETMLQPISKLNVFTWMKTKCKLPPVFFSMAWLGASK